MTLGIAPPPRYHDVRSCLVPAGTEAPPAAGLPARLAVLAYGVVAYVATLATFAWLAGFVGNVLTPTRLDAPGEGPLGPALVVDALLVALFAAQHSVMARPWFKRWWTRAVPEAAERSTYLIFSCAALAALFAFWRPLGGVVWSLEHPLARAGVTGLYAGGWALLLLTTFLINHFDLFGLRQTWLFARGRAYRTLPFRTPLFYDFVRHPLYVGWLVVFWAAPTMTVAHLVLAAGMTAYILLAIRWEERDLVDLHPEYAAYRARTPKFVPRLGTTARRVEFPRDRAG